MYLFTAGAFGRSGIYTLMSMFTLVFFQNGAGLIVHMLCYAVFQSISQTLTFTFQTFLFKVNTAVATIVFGEILGQNDFKTVDKSLVDIEGRQNMNQQN